MSWEEDVEKEMRGARDAAKIGNHGRTRTCARRAVGIAASELQNRDRSFSFGADFIAKIRSIAGDIRFEEEVREAASRLQARIAADFTSISTDPIRDAEVVVSALSGLIQGGQERSSER